jgi:hypothetical protein
VGCTIGSREGVPGEREPAIRADDNNKNSDDDDNNNNNNNNLSTHVCSK